MGLRLYEIPAEWREVEELIEEAGGEITPEIEDRMEVLEGDLSAKVDVFAALVREAAARSEAFAAESKLFSDKARVAKNKAEGLKRYMKDTLERMGRTAAEGELFKVRIQQNPERVADEGLDPDRLPERYVKVETVKTVDKAKILADYKTGRALPEGVIVVRGSHVRFT